MHLQIPLTKFATGQKRRWVSTRLDPALQRYALHFVNNGTWPARGSGTVIDIRVDESLDGGASWTVDCARMDLHGGGWEDLKGRPSNYFWWHIEAPHDTSNCLLRVSFTIKQPCVIGFRVNAE